MGIYMYHMRKGGGTTLRNNIKNYCNKNSCKYDVEEGNALTYDKLEENDVFKCINIRYPVTRFLSLYIEQVFPSSRLEGAKSTFEEEKQNFLTISEFIEK